MVRRYDDQVDVRTAVQELDDGSAGDASPDAFVWRGRLYVVRAVQARWHERRAWWRDPAASALLGLRADDLTGGGAALAAASTSTALAGECEVWRIEATAGRSSPIGVYDLVRIPGPSDTWHLARVAD